MKRRTFLKLMGTSLVACTAGNWLPAFANKAREEVEKATFIFPADLYTEVRLENLFRDLLQTNHPDDTMDAFFDAEGTVNLDYRFIFGQGWGNRFPTTVTCLAGFTVIGEKRVV